VNDEGKLLARLLAGEPFGTDVEPNRARDILYLAMTELTLKVVGHEPCVFVVEDVQWSDPESVAWFGHLLNRSAGRPIFALVLARPSFWKEVPNGFQGRGNQRLELRPIPRRATMELARAVLRCDDRGIGGSGGDFASSTTDDFVSDAVSEFIALARVDQVDRSRIGIVGHSEGGLVAPMAAVKLSADKAAPSSPAVLVLMAGTGVDGDAILREQNTKLLRASGLTDEQIAPVRAAHSAFLDAVKQGADPVVLKARARELVLSQAAMGGMDMTKVPEAALNEQADGAVQQVSSPWMKRFLTLDPTEALRQVSCPVMVLNGSLDAQVSAEQNVPAIEAALKQAAAKDPRAQATVKVMPGLNHLFQPAKTGSIDEYTTIETTISPEVLDAIGAWVLAQPSRNVPPLPTPAAGAAPGGVPVAPSK
jgi:pimeloyl-ACP methyl ester carboxylesterase